MLLPFFLPLPQLIFICVNQACKTLLTCHPTSLPLISNTLLPGILNCLIPLSSDQGEEVRYVAADVLGVVCKLLFKLESQSGERSGCIQGKDNTRGEGQTDYVTTWYTFAMHVRAFIEQSSRRDRRLVHVLSGALSAPTTTTTNSKAKVGLGSNGNPKPKHSTPSCTPATWSIQTLLILLILSTPSLAHTHSHSLQYSPFTHPRSLKL